LLPYRKYCREMSAVPLMVAGAPRALRVWQEKDARPRCRARRYPWRV